MRFSVLTLFPEMILQGMNNSIIGRAIGEGRIAVEAVNIRDYTQDKHRRVDDYTYGGGAGMLLQAQPVYDAWKSVRDGIGGEKPVRTVYVTPQGRPFTQKLAAKLAREEELILLCGHYEGVDERVLEEIVTDYVSIGDYVLTGGELAAMVMMDAIARLAPGVLHNEESPETESFQGGLLEYPQYTRPDSWHGKAVPDILLTGDQRKIREWRLRQSEVRTKERRPDLYAEYERLQECRRQLLRDKLLHIDMIEQINRGRAELLFFEEGEIFLRDRETGVGFHTKPDGARSPRFAQAVAAEELGAFREIVFHQKDMGEIASEQLSMEIDCVCYQAVLTRREKLPTSGLYRTDGLPVESGAAQGMVIRPLGMEHLSAVMEHYHLADDPAYIAARIQKKQMFGAFFGETLAGFIGWHAEGSIGMLEVFPEYRRRHIGAALETYMMNQALERGMTPYGQVIVGNDASAGMQRKLGLYFSREPVYWAGKDIWYAL